MSRMCARSSSMSPAERTNDRATKSAPASQAISRSVRSFEVIAGSSGRAKVTLTPFRADSGPGETTRARTSVSVTPATLKRGTPSPITISDCAVHRRAKPSKSTVTRSSPPPSPLPVNVRRSPTSRSRAAVAPDNRSFGPWRSNSTPSALSVRCDAARTSRARRSRSSAPPCEQFTRAQSMPAATRRSSTPGASVAGPRVARIFVRRSVITLGSLASPSTRQPPALERPPQLHETARIAQRGARHLLEAAQPVPERVRVHVQHARGLLDAHLLVEPRSQRRVELGPHAPERVERLEVARGERVAERLVGEDRRADREVRQREGTLLPECDRGLQRTARDGERLRDGRQARRRPQPAGDAGDRLRRACRDAGEVAVERDHEPAVAGERGGRAVRERAAAGRPGAERDERAVGVEPVRGAVAAQLGGR